MATQSSVLAWKSHGSSSLAGYSPWAGKRAGQDLANEQQCGWALGLCEWLSASEISES